MIRPDGFRGAAFGTAADGDARSNAESRQRFAVALGIPPAWGYARQVHGATVVTATRPGLLGEADALLTTPEGPPVCVATADCVPVIIEGEHTAAVVHAGWRGISSGVVRAALAAMRATGDRPQRAAVGPAIGPCCYEVGREVADALAPFVAETSWGTTSVDLLAAVVVELGAIPVWRADLCTYRAPTLHSYRRNGTDMRQTAVTWLPSD